MSYGQTISASPLVYSHYLLAGDKRTTTDLPHNIRMIFHPVDIKSWQKLLLGTAGGYSPAGSVFKSLEWGGGSLWDHGEKW